MASILGEELKDRLLQKLLTEHRWAASQQMFTATFERAWAEEVQPTLDEANRFLDVPYTGASAAEQSEGSSS